MKQKTDFQIPIKELLEKEGLSEKVIEDVADDFGFKGIDIETDSIEDFIYSDPLIRSIFLWNGTWGLFDFIDNHIATETLCEVFEGDRESTKECLDYLWSEEFNKQTKKK